MAESEDAAAPTELAPRADGAGGTAAPPAPPSLGSRAIRASLWTIAGYGTNQLLRLGSNLLLTRLLFPEAFGLMALVSAFLVGLQMFSDLGVTPSIVQSKRGDDPAFLNTAWTLQIVRGTLLALLASCLAWPLASFYDQPQLSWLLSAAGVTVFLSGLNSTSLARFSRHMQLGKVVLLELGAQISSIVVMIAWALAHPTVWALLGGGVTASLVRMILSHALAGDRPNGLRWDRGAAGELLRFGKWIFLSTSIAFLVGQSDRLIFGKLISLSTLGVYSIALMLSALPTQLINRIGTSAVFPALSRAREGPAGSFEQVYTRARLPLMVLGGLIVAALIGSGPALVETLYDPRYAAAGWMLQLLAAVAWLQVLEVPSGSVLLALGSPRWLAYANGMKLFGFVAFVPIGFWLHGLAGAIAGILAAELLRYATCALGVHRRRLPVLRRDLVMSLLVLVAAAAGLYGAYAAGRAGHSPIIRLVSAVGIVSGLWLLVACIALRQEIRRIWAALRTRRLTIQ